MAIADSRGSKESRRVGRRSLARLRITGTQRRFELLASVLKVVARDRSFLSMSQSVEEYIPILVIRNKVS